MPLKILGVGMALLLWAQVSWAADAPPAAAGDDMALIPAGEFTMGIDDAGIENVTKKVGGSRKDQENATPAHKETLPDYYMDKYEVTNAQYKKFAEATKHAAPEFWEEGKMPEGKKKHPVVGVSWHDAEAYCKWAGKRLPTEAEWEKAARGTDGRLFPWGDKFARANANTRSGGKENTTPVGSYPAGASPYGCYDMAGNVLEWTASHYLAYPGTKHEDEFYGDERYVSRGGSWDDEDYYATCTSRTIFSPETTFEHLGFRCSRSK